MQIIQTHIVPKQKNPIRLQEYAVGIFNTIATRSAIKKAIKKELILVNEQIALTATLIVGGEKISLLESKNKHPHRFLDFPLEIMFEDDHLAIINKPPGILVSGNKFKTIDNALPQNLKKSTCSDAVRPRPVHRLDYPTTGLLLIGKTSTTILALNALFEKKKIEKTYHAITIGNMDNKGIIASTVDDKEALSYFTVLDSQPSDRFDVLNLVQLVPKTGRRHQLRKHLFNINAPILGDKEYSIKELVLKGKGLYLHASSLSFIHPKTKQKMTVVSKLPKKFTKIFPDY